MGGLTEMLAGSFLLLTALPLVTFVLLCLAAVYVSLRIRDARAEPNDPQLGLKSAYYFFLSVSIILALFGLTLATIDLVDGILEPKADNPRIGGNPGGGPFGPKGGGFGNPAPPVQDELFGSSAQRVAWPLVISGSLFALCSMLGLKLNTNDTSFPAVRRTFVGARLATAGIMVMMGFTALLLVLFQKNLQTARPYAFPIGLLIVWGPTVILHLVLMRMYGNLPYFVPPKPKKVKARDWEADERDEEEQPRRKPTRRRDGEDEDEGEAEAEPRKRR